MRNFALLLFSIFCGPAIAAPGSFTLTCHGVQRADGDQGRQGTVVISAVDQTPAGQVNESWNLSVAWQGSSKSLLGANSVCGAPVPAGAVCDLQREGSSNLATQFFTECINPKDGSDSRGHPHRAAQANLTLSAGRGHGFFFCDSDKTGSEDVELSQCHSMLRGY